MFLIPSKNKKKIKNRKMANTVEEAEKLAGYQYGDVAKYIYYLNRLRS